MPQVSRLSAALYLAKQGWKVFPLHTPTKDGGCSCRSKDKDHSIGKHPVSKGWKTEATDDPAKITSWWKKNPEANIGIATGATSSLAVLDIDGPEGEAIVASKGHEPTVTVVTGNGRQLYFKYPGETVRNKVKTFPDLDSRGDGGYVVAPGSLHYSGKLYKFDPEKTPDKVKLALAPQWWLQAVLDSASPMAKPEQVAPSEVPKTVKKGGRNSTLASMAGVLRDKGLSVDAIKYALYDYNKAHCEPPLDQDEVDTIANSYGKYQAGDPNKKHTCSEATELLRANRHFLTSPIDSGGCGVKLMLYEGGVYKQNGADIARRMADKMLGKASRPDTISSIVDLIRERTKIGEEHLNVRASELINTASGMLEWRTGKVHEHSHEFLSTYQLSAAYDPRAKSDVLDEFMNQVFPSDTIELIEEIIGYLMVPSVKYQKAFMLVGEGANGKSTFLHMLSQFLQEVNVSRMSLQQLEDSPFAVAELQGKLANVYADIPSTRLEKSDTFKSIVAGDQIKAEKKFGHPFVLRTFARLLFSANEFPRSADSSPAFFRRWTIINFPNKFEGQKADPELIKKLVTPNVMSALLNRAVAGLKRLEDQQHFSEAESANKQAELYRVENNSSYAYIRECLLPVDAKSVIAKSELYERYVQWCAASGIKYPEPTRRFNKTVENALGVVEVQHGPKRTKSWAGVKYQESAFSMPREAKY